jgi:hypothetical protein
MLEKRLPNFNSEATKIFLNIQRSTAPKLYKQGRFSAKSDRLTGWLLPVTCGRQVWFNIYVVIWEVHHEEYPEATFYHACGGGNSTDSVQPAIQEMIAGKFAAYKMANKLPDDSGILVHLQTPKGAWTAAAGFKADEDKSWHYRIASVSKTFTAASIMLLDQQGRLRIDDRLTDMIPGTTDPYLVQVVDVKNRTVIKTLSFDPIFVNEKEEISLPVGLYFWNPRSH